MPSTKDLANVFDRAFCLVRLGLALEAISCGTGLSLGSKLLSGEKLCLDEDSANLDKSALCDLKEAELVLLGKRVRSSLISKSLLKEEEGNSADGGLGNSISLDLATTGRKLE
ncbi:hypothetical protein BpHYR1_033682 [Brachionus plicatilis]|uniref:Uncharacterized protein n=1 Tax=Brachionus plicatilis TaxID=10195 RepID=A0A3M7Q8V7_BRAPC|nr:hypothetical protein BpHYR1_033682 [Brachionus plicatilis]